MIEIFLNQNRRSIKAELSDYFRKKAPSSSRKQLLSSSAFTRARAKLKETAFIQLLQDTVHFFQAHVLQSLRSSWHGYRILAVAGSDFTLPDIPELCEYFSGRTVHSIKQDVHASVLIQKLIALECFASKPLINKKVKSRSFDYIINFTAAISQFKSIIVDFLNQQLRLDEIYLHLKLIANDLTIVKPGRSFERKKVRCKRQKNRKGYNK